MSVAPPPSTIWENLLNDEEVIVIKKSTFFESLDLMFNYAHDPKRCTWEFYSYRPWQYILGTWCATFDIAGSAFSCGAQHPFIHRVPPKNKIVEYCLPDYALIFTIPALADRQNQLVLIGEVKPIGMVHPDTVDGQQRASTIFMRTGRQRKNQAKLGFRDHPDQDILNILMICGPWYSIYDYKREEFFPAPRNGAEPADTLLETGPLDGQSPPRKTRRQGARTFYRVPPAKRVRPVPDASIGDESAEAGAKRKRETSSDRSQAFTEKGVVRHVMQLPDKRAFNPWFLAFLQSLTAPMEVHTGKLQMQRSWFNSFVDSELENDGHAKGWTLPTVAELWTRTKVQVLKEEEDVEEFRRLDEDVEEPDDKTPSTPGTASKTLAPLLWNALLSPRLRKGQTSQHGIDDPPPDDPYGSAGERSLELDDGDGSREIEADGAATPTAHVHRSLSLPNLSQENTELMSSPSAAYLQRKRLGAGIRREDVQLAAPSSGSTSLAPIVPASTSDVGAPDSSSVRARDNSARLGGMRRRWPPPVGPLYPKELPNGKRLPHDWATMTTSDQILMLCLSTPQDSQGNRMFKEAFQNIGLPSTQLREMLGYVQDLKSANQEKSRQTSTTPGILLPRRSVARPSAAEQLAGVLRDKNLQQAKDRHLNIGSRESRPVGHKEDVSEKGKERARS